MLGIEAARKAIVVEIRKTLEEQGLEVDVRHIMLLADLMTMEGEIKQIGRHGISGEKSSILARASFEVTTNHYESCEIWRNRFFVRSNRECYYRATDTYGYWKC